MAELDSQPKSVQSIYTWYAEARLKVNRRYQRKLVWTLEEKQKLIESALRRYPIPAILLAEREDGYELIDGLQRVHTLMSFIEMKFSTDDGRFFAVSEFPTANTRGSDGKFEVVDDQPLLSPREVSAILDYSLAVSIMRGATEAEVDDVFARINTYGHRLSEQERRQAGVRGEFPQLVRELSCQLRGDASAEIVELEDMPTISIDLPMSRHGYDVTAKDVFWVEHGVLRSTDLRDSMDEQCVADIAASIVGGSIIPRSKDALDLVYEQGSTEYERLETALATYGDERISAEFKFVIDEISKVGKSDEHNKLRDVLFERRTTNPFPSMFAVLFLAFHEVLIGERKEIADYAALRKALTNLDSRVETSRRATASDERRQNVDVIKGLIYPHVIDGSHDEIYGEITSFDVNESLRRSEIEAPHYELKQGLLRLDSQMTVDENLIPKVLKTICAMANNGADRAGKIFIGVADDEADAKRVEALYGTAPLRVGQKYVVGIRREATQLGETAEDYVARFKTAIKNSNMSEPLKSGVLTSVTYSDYFGYGVLILAVPPQSKPSSLDGNVYVREGDETVEVSGVGLFDVAERFK